MILYCIAMVLQNVHVILYVSVMYSCYYTSTNCKYFFDRECYENYTSMDSASRCDTVLGGYFLGGRCYYNEPRNCGDGYYQQCTCYPHRSSTYTNITCDNIGGFYTGGYCYYDEFACRRYAVNGQCYHLVTSTSFTLCLILYILLHLISSSHDCIRFSQCES